MLTVAALKLGTARLANVFNAEGNAYTQVTAGQGVTVASDLIPGDSIATAAPGLPGLPDRYDEALNSRKACLSGRAFSRFPPRHSPTKPFSWTQPGNMPTRRPTRWAIRPHWHPGFRRMSAPKIIPPA